MEKDRTILDLESPEAWNRLEEYAALLESEDPHIAPARRLEFLDALARKVYADFPASGVGLRKESKGLVQKPIHAMADRRLEDCSRIETALKTVRGCWGRSHGSSFTELYPPLTLVFADSQASSDFPASLGRRSSASSAIETLLLLEIGFESFKRLLFALIVYDCGRNSNCLGKHTRVHG